MLFAFPPYHDATLPRTLVTLLAVATGALAISVGARLYAQCRTTDVFFMDWERPRGAARDPEGKERPLAVSVWRSLFVANEWARLAVHRRVPVPLTIGIFVVAQQVLGLRALCYARYNGVAIVIEEMPAVADDVSVRLDPLLTFAVNGLTWLVLTALMLLYNFAMCQRFGSHRPLRFLDLLIVSMPLENPTSPTRDSSTSAVSRK